MKLVQIHQLSTIVESGSLRSAAKRLGMSQPALSKSIQLLEKDLNCQIFARNIDGMKLTRVGEIIYKRGLNVLNETSKIKEEISSVLGLDNGSISIALSVVPLVDYFEAVLNEFRKKYPKIKIKIMEALFPDAEIMLRNGSLDFYVGASPGSEHVNGLSIEVLDSNEIGVIARENHPKLNSSNLSQLLDCFWASVSVESNLDCKVKSFFQLNNLPDPQVNFYAKSALSLALAISSSDLLALLPLQWCSFPLLAKKLVQIKISEKLSAPPIVLVKKNDLPLTPPAEYFLDLIKREIVFSSKN